MSEPSIDWRQMGTLRRIRVLLVAAGLAVSLGLATPVAAGSPYDSSEAGHPVRIAAYVLHPFGVVLDTLIFRPAYWLGSHEPLKTLFGVTD